MHSLPEEVLMHLSLFARHLCYCGGKFVVRSNKHLVLDDLAKWDTTYDFYATKKTIRLREDKVLEMIKVRFWVHRDNTPRLGIIVSSALLPNWRTKIGGLVHYFDSAVELQWLQDPPEKQSLWSRWWIFSAPKKERELLLRRKYFLPVEVKA